MAKRVRAILAVEVANKTNRMMSVLPGLIRQATERQAFRQMVTAGLRRGATPALQAARQAALNLPSKGTASPVHGRRYMRQRMARSLDVTVRTARDPAVSIISRRDRMGDAPMMPRVTNQGAWRHPVFGKDVWVTQTSRAGWFDNTVRAAGQNHVRSELTKVLTLLEGRWTV